MRLTTPWILALGTLLCCSQVRAVQYWADDSENWFDFAQMGGDGCAIATSASMIWWWQQQSGLKNPVHTTIDQIHAPIWDALDGGPTWIHTGLSWYLSTYYPEINYADVVTQSPYFWKNGDAMATSHYLKDCLSQGLLVALDSYSHAQIIWGAEFDDETGMVSKVWLTDPGPDSAVNTLEVFDVSPYSLDEGGSLSFVKYIYREDGTGYDMQSFGVRYLYTMSPITVPEPSSAFLASLGLSLVCFRRRR